jgi:hypothetical protein
MTNTAQETLHTCSPKYWQYDTKFDRTLSLGNEELQGVESFFAISVAQPVKNTAAFVQTKGSVCQPPSKKFVTELYHKPD